jgi:hypothetical protein
MNFKMSGYTLSMGKSNVPLSAMVQSSFSRVQKALSDGSPQDNGQPAEQASVFLAGRIAENIGAFIQATSASGGNIGMDNADIRYATQTTVADKPAIVGISLNNNPTVSDPFNTLPAWGAPYIGGAGGSASSVMLDGGLAQKAWGLNAYTLFDNKWYAELGGYTAASRSFLQNTNVIANSDPYDKSDGISPYWRLAYMGNAGSGSYTAGVFGMQTKVILDPTSGVSGVSDKYNDIGVDGSYILQRDNSDTIAINGSVINENRQLDATQAAGGVENANNTLQKVNLHASYYFHDTYGLTLGTTRVSGSADGVLYAPNTQDVGFAGNVPDTDSYMLQADWTPFGKNDSWGAPFANLRLGAQYTMFTKYNGATTNYDGNGRNASDNNTLYLFAWMSI